MASPSGSLQARLDALQAARPDVPGFAIAVIEGDAITSAASGVADPAGKAMTAQTPFRLASVTKPFVAAALLRLAEQGKLDIDTPIAGLIAAQHRSLLEQDGYDTQRITVRHLMMHSAGLADHFSSPEGRAAAFEDPARDWTRTQQIALMTRYTQPLGQPGEAFVYSDTGYIVLGEILEKLSGKTLPQAVRELNHFDRLGISDLRWEALKGEAETGEARAHQWIDGFDIHALNGSLDAFGGGGLIGNVIDTARYFDALFSGEVFADDKTLSVMTSAKGHPTDSPYRLGLFTRTIDGTRVYSHGGFWGVHAVHAPSLDLTIVCVALGEEGEGDVRALATQLIRERLSAKARITAPR